MSSQPKHFYEFGPFRLDPEKQRLLRDGEPVPLTPKALATLLVLIKNSGQVVEKDSLMGAVWPGTFVEDGILSVNINALRKALGETAEKRQYIETIPRRGYRFVAAVREVPGEGAEAAGKQTRSQTVTGEETAGQGTAPDEINAPQDTRIQSKRRPSLHDAVRSIAVLPFKLLSADDEDEYLGLGMADALITRLSNVGQIIVRPTSAVHKYAVAGRDPVAAGRELRVESVLDGNIQRSDDRIRLTVQLVSVVDEAPLWAERFDEKFTDIFAVEDSISEQVVRALMLRLTSEERRLLTKHYTENTEAYRLYLKGRYFWNKRTGEGFKKGIECFQQAIEMDPVYALAYSGLADCFGMLSWWRVLPPEVGYPRARAAAAAALEIDDTLAEVRTSSGMVKVASDFDFVGAHMEFQRAIELNPRYTLARYWNGAYWIVTGRADEAIAETKRGLEIDPVSLNLNAGLGAFFYYARRYDESVEQLRKTLDMDPNFTIARVALGWAYEQKKMYGEAIAELQRAVESSSGNSMIKAQLGHAYAVSGQLEEARGVLEELREMAKQRYVSPYDLATIYAGLGERDEALEHLEKACEERSGWFVILGEEPKFDGLRSEPRFQDLLRRIGLTG